jgi:type VI secretion system lysozyme-like protein
MVGPRVLPGCLPPLFERLFDLSPGSPGDRADASRLRGDDVRLSIARGVARLLDTRRNVPLAEAARSEGLTVLDYGIPDFGLASPEDLAARFLMSEAIRKAIVAFEPRLRAPEVELRSVAGQRGVLDVHVTGHLDDGETVEPVSFWRALDAARSDMTHDHGS